MKVLLLVIAFAAVSPVWNTDGGAFNVSLELQGANCSDQLTLICKHSDILSDPNWDHNRTAEGGQLLEYAFPGVMYSVQSNTEHRVTISGVGNVQALDGYSIQCVYSILGNLIKSNAVKYSFIPDYRPALSLVTVTADFSERLCTFNYSYQENCSLYPRCTPYLSVEYTVSPLSAVSNTSSGCSVEYTIRNLRRCVSYQSTATALLNNQRGIPVVVGDTVMLSPGQFTITSVSIGADRDLINVTYMKNEPDCPGYPTEWYTVDVDGVQVADLTADAVQSLAINHASGSVTLFLPLNQPLPENAVTLNMTKYNTVPTNRSNVKGNIVTEMVTWGTSAVFYLSQESSAAMNDKGAVSVVVGAIISVIFVTIVIVIAIAVALVIAQKCAKESATFDDLKTTNDPPNEVQPQGQCGCGPTPAAASQGPQPVKGTNEHPVSMTDKVESEAVSEEEAPVTLGEMSEEGSDTTTKEYVVSDEEVEPPPSSAAGTVDETLEVCEPEEECRSVTDSTQETAYVGGDGCKRIGRQPKVDLTRENTAGRVEPQKIEKTICAFKNDPSTCYISGDKDIPRMRECHPATDSTKETAYVGGDGCKRIGRQGQRTTQGLTYITVDHSQRRPINVPNENLDVQYTGVRFDTKAPAV